MGVTVACWLSPRSATVVLVVTSSAPCHPRPSCHPHAPFHMSSIKEAPSTVTSVTPPLQVGTLKEGQFDMSHIDHARPSDCGKIVDLVRAAPTPKSKAA